MGLTHEKLEFLQNLFAAVKDYPDRMNDWEYNFMKDQEARFEEYGALMLLSAKQWAIIERVGKEKYELEPPSR